MNRPEQALQISVAEYLTLTRPECVWYHSPNGGGRFVNEYTVIMDVSFPDISGAWVSLLQTNNTNSNDGDWFINPDGALGTAGNYGGSISEAEWHRLPIPEAAQPRTLIVQFPQLGEADVPFRARFLRTEHRLAIRRVFQQLDLVQPVFQQFAHHV